MENLTEQSIENSPSLPAPIIVSQSPNILPKIILFTTLGLIIFTASVFIGIQIGRNQVIPLQLTSLIPTASPSQSTSPAQAITIPSAQPTATSNTQLKATPIVSPNPNWRTYDSTLYPYSVRYPNDWQVNETKHGSPSTIDPSKSKLMTRISSDKSSITIYFEGDFDHGFEPWIFSKSEEVNMGGKVATKSILTLDGNPNEWIIYTIKDFHDFRIEANVSPSDKNLVDLILSTFSFAN